MKKFLKYCFNKLPLIFVFVLVVFLFSFLLVNMANMQVSYYEASFQIENIEINKDELVNYEYLESIKESADKYENIDVAKILKNNGFRLNKSLNTYYLQSEYKYYDEFYLKSILNVSTRAKTFFKDAISGLAKDNNVNYGNSNIVVLKAYTSPWLVSFLNTLFISILNFILFIFYYLNDKTNEKVIQKEKVNYWKLCFKPLTKVKDMCLIAMLFALMLACKFIPIPSGFANLGLSFTYLFFATICLVYGPVYGFVIGAFSDIIGFFINSGGGYFNLGYTLQASLTGFIYGICFYHRKFSFGKTLLARLLVNLLMNVVLGSILWIVVMYLPNESDMTLNRFLQLTCSYAFYYSLPKNVLYLLPQSILLYVILKAFIPILKRYKYIDK